MPCQRPTGVRLDSPSEKTPARSSAAQSTARIGLSAEQRWIAPRRSSSRSAVRRAIQVRVSSYGNGRRLGGRIVIAAETRDSPVQLDESLERRITTKGIVPRLPGQQVLALSSPDDEARRVIVHA